MHIPPQKQEDNTLLELYHEDYALYIVASQYAAIREKAKSLINDEEALQTEYRWSEGASLFLKDRQESATEDGETDGKEAKCSMVGPASFFENTDYQVTVVFDENANIKDVKLLSPLIEGKGKPEDKASYIEKHHILSFNLNYGNDIGQSDIKVEYRKDDKKCQLLLHYDVLSTKLDYHKDLRCILEDIEREYTMLCLAFLRKTYHTFSEDNNATETPDLIWWNIFKGVQEEFCRAVSKVIESPHNRLRVQHNYRRADQLRHVSPLLENEWNEHKDEERRLYRTEEWVLNDDTVENRFVKFALNNIRERFHRLKEKIIKGYPDLSEYYRAEMQTTDETLNRLCNAPFLRRIGRFTGLKGENLTLKQATGYSTIYRDWLLLQSTYDLHEGIQSMQLKDIATLYEIWCFIEVKNIVRQLLAERSDIPLDDVDQFTISDDSAESPLSGNFVLELDKGMRSKVILKHDEVALAEVIYNAYLGDKDNSKGKSGLGPNVGVHTVPQRPDIVLRLTKADVEKGIEMTYLFDAKYRLENDGNPPEDTINQMHRYRDAIYYSEHDDDALKKEVIGGYILFPGDDSKDEFAKSKLYESIGKVNIGAFPLRPDVNGTKDSLLRDFLRTIISMPRRDVLMESIPQRGLNYTDEPVVEGEYLVSIIDKKINNNFEELMNGTAKFFVSGYEILTNKRINYQSIRYFVPRERHGANGVYRVERVRVVDISDKLKELVGMVDERQHDHPYRIGLTLGGYTPINGFEYGVDHVYDRVLNREQYLNRFISETRMEIEQKRAEDRSLPMEII